MFWERELASLPDCAVPSLPGNMARFQSTLRCEIILRTFMSTRRLVSACPTGSDFLRDFISLVREIRPLKGFERDWIWGMCTLDIVLCARLW